MKKILFFLSIILSHTQIHAQRLDWAKQVGGSYIDRALGVTIDAAGNVYTTGHFQVRADFDPGPDSFFFSSTSSGEAFILKQDASGNFVKAMSYGSAPGGHITVGSNIATDAAGNFYITGYFYGSNIDFDPDTAVVHKAITDGGENNAYVLKLDAAGKFVWVKNWAYSKDAGSNSNEELGPSSVIDENGNITLAGRFKGTVDFDPGAGVFKLRGKSEDGYITKLDAAGNFIWAGHLASDTSMFSNVYPKSVAVDASGNTYVAGIFDGTVDFDPDTTTSYTLTSKCTHGFVMKIDASGKFMWAKKIGSDAKPILEYHEANAVWADGAGNSYVTGSFMGTIELGSFTITSVGNSDIYIAKLDASGNYIWVKQMGSMYDSEEGSRITADASGNIYVTGIYRGTIDFNPGVGVNNLSTNGSIDVFILKLTPSGDYMWAKGFGGTGSGERIFDIVVKDNSVYTVGKFNNTVNFDPNGNLSLTAIEKYYTDAFVHKMDQTGASGIVSVNDENRAVVYPNPAKGYVNIRISDFHQDATAILLDLTGRKVWEGKLNSETTTISLNGIARGTYLLKIQNQDTHEITKLFIE